MASSPATELLADPLLRDVPVLEGHKVLAGVALYAKVGQGGMGVVYRGRHCLLDVDMAVKVLKPSLLAEDERFALRFRREAQVAAAITHQNVIRLYEANQQCGLHYLLMEFVDGESARDRVPRKGPLPEAEALGILLGAAAGLAEAHRAGIVHRDIKPDNVLIARDGRVKLADLGLVKREAGQGGDSVTLGSGIMGTPQYMAPEQWDTPDVTPAADIWALGATLWYLLVGKHAVEAPTLAAVARRVQEQDLPSLRQARPGLQAATYALFERCVARRPDARFADARALVEALLPLVRGGEERLADPEAGIGGSRPSLPTPPPRATIEKIRDALGTDTQLAGSAARRGEAPTIVAKGQTVVAGKAQAPEVRQPSTRRRRWTIAVGVGVVALGIALSFAASREFCLSCIGMARYQRGERLLAAARAAKAAGQMDLAIEKWEQALALDYGWIDSDFREALTRRADRALATQPLAPANAECAFLDTKRVADNWPGDKQAGERFAEAKANLEAALQAALRLDRPLEGEVCEGGRVVASGNLEWPGGGCVGLFTTPELASSASRGSFLAPEFSVSCQTIGLGLWQPWLKVSGRFGDVIFKLPRHVFVPGVAGMGSEQAKSNWLGDVSSYATTRIWNRAGIVMMPVPVRKFTMGSLDVALEHKPDEVQHDATLTEPFWLGSSEVTRAQWMRVMGTSPWLDTKDAAPGTEPATRIPWDLANEFCAKLTKLESDEKRMPPGYRYTLPTEAQWELAANGGGYLRWVHGDKVAGLEQCAVFGNAIRFAEPVATRKANAFGLFDLAGNVDEWCADSASIVNGLVVTTVYAAGAVEPLAEDGPARVYRGGNYGSTAIDCRNAARFAAPPDTARDTLGFRVALAKR